MSCSVPWHMTLAAHVAFEAKQNRTHREIRTVEQEHSREMHLAKDHQFGQGHGKFLEGILTAFTRADPDNFDLLSPVVKVLTEKYSLGCTCDPHSPDALDRSVAGEAP